MATALVWAVRPFERHGTLASQPESIIIRNVCIFPIMPHILLLSSGSHFSTILLRHGDMVTYRILSRHQGYTLQCHAFATRTSLLQSRGRGVLHSVAAARGRPMRHPAKKKVPPVSSGADLHFAKSGAEAARRPVAALRQEAAALAVAEGGVHGHPSARALVRRGVLAPPARAAAAVEARQTTGTTRETTVGAAIGGRAEAGARGAAMTAATGQGTAAAKVKEEAQGSHIGGHTTT